MRATAILGWGVWRGGWGWYGRFSALCLCVGRLGPESLGDDREGGEREREKERGEDQRVRERERERESREERERERDSTAQRGLSQSFPDSTHVHHPSLSPVDSTDPETLAQIFLPKKAS